MKCTKLFVLIAFAAFLGLVGIQVAAAEHDCAAHCATHTDPDAKMCTDHCSGVATADHDCAAHCKSLPADDPDQDCAKHCSTE